jgi:hypothetical protein
MSLHQLANHLQSKGREGDEVLVHMTPGEVGGLQALAMAHGGSLTINPETGLPEANFLKKLLPTIAGFGLSMIPGVGPLMAAGIVGGGTALATGNLGKGLMAGLGAYGGAGLAAGLTGVGAAGAAKAAGTSAVEASKLTAGAGGTPIFSKATSGAVTLPSQATAANTVAAPSAFDKLVAGAKTLAQPGGFTNLYNALPGGTLPALGTSVAGAMDQKGITPRKEVGMIRPYEYTRTQNQGVYDMGAPIYSDTPGSSAEKDYFTDSYTALTPYAAPGPEYPKAADGGLVALAVGGPVETMSALNAIGGNMQYPQANLQTALYSNPMIQRPEAVNVISPGEGPAVGAYSGEQKFAGGGLSNLGGYSDGGRLLKGPGDGVSDSIPAVIGQRQPARLADGEFVIPARIVSELGNGSTEAGAKKLYKMMDRVQNARKKSIGKKKVAVDSRAEKLLPA